MDLALSEAEADIRSSVGRWIDQHYPTHVLTRISREDNAGFMQTGWRELAEQGWLGLVTAERFGGGGGTCMDAVALFEALGRAPVRGPMLASSVVSSSLITRLAPEALADEVVPGIVDGSRVVLPVCVAPARLPARMGRCTFQTGPDGTLSLTGEVVVLDGGSATDLLVLALDERDRNRAVLVLVGHDAEGVSMTPMRGFGGSAAHLVLSGATVAAAAVVADLPEDPWRSVREALAPTLPVLAAYQVGSCERMLEMSIAYSNQRKQFGRPIGAFQRVQDHVVRIVNSLDSARWATYYAASSVDSGAAGAELSCYVAKAIVADAHVEAADAAHEVHAGVGSDLDFGLTLHSALSRALHPFLGGPGLYKQVLGSQLIMAEQRALSGV